MIWIKLKHKDAVKAVVYTSDIELAASMEMHKKNKGKFWYKTIAAKNIKKALGFIAKIPRGGYMQMVHMYPEASAYIKRMEKIPPDVKQRMEEHMEWNNETKTFNKEKRLDV